MKKNLLLTFFIFLLGFAPLILSAQSQNAKIAYNNAVKAYNAKDFVGGASFLEDVVEEFPDFIQAQRLIAECYKGMKDEANVQKHYTAVLQQQPRQPNLWYSLGLSYIRTKDTKRAKTAFDKVLEFNPAHAKALRQLSYLGENNSTASADPLSPKGGGSVKKNKKEETKKTPATSNISSGKPNSNLYAKYANKGVGYYNERQFQEAILAFDKALEYKTSAKLLSYAARARMHEKQVDEAIELLKKAVAKDSESGEFHYYLSKAYELKGIDNLTEKYASMASNRGFAGTAEVFNSEATKHYNEGIDFYQKKRYTDAIQAYQRAIEEDPNKAKYHYNLALVYMEVNRQKEAKAELEEALAIDPGFGYAYKLMGDYYYNNKKYEKAGAFYSDAIAYGNDTYNDYMNLGYAYDRMGNHKKAVEYFLVAEEKAPNHIEVRHTVAMSYFKGNEFASAEKKFLEVLTDEPEHIRTLFNLSAVYDRIGEFDKGLKYAHQIIELRPTDGEAYHQAGVLYGHKGDWKSKDKYMRKAASLGYNHDPLTY